ncbi:MAG: hypothetical protein N3G21_05460 [Candidatus Hydrogenedentes bacterium]|nr:hypothetical protein [Candidatus Hydrogenedentota bacterium]
MFKSLLKISVVVCLLIYGVCDSHVGFKPSVGEWERLVSHILRYEIVANFFIYDVNDDGWVDVRDLCALYSKLARGANRDSTRKNIKVYEAVIIKDEYNKHLTDRQSSGIRLVRVRDISLLGACFNFSVISKKKGDVEGFHITFHVQDSNKLVFPIRC